MLCAGGAILKLTLRLLTRFPRPPSPLIPLSGRVFPNQRVPHQIAGKYNAHTLILDICLVFKFRHLTSRMLVSLSIPVSIWSWLDPCLTLPSIPLENRDDDFLGSVKIALLFHPLHQHPPKFKKLLMLRSASASFVLIQPPQIKAHSRLKFFTGDPAIKRNVNQSSRNRGSRPPHCGLLRARELIDSHARRTASG